MVCATRVSELKTRRNSRTGIRVRNSKVGRGRFELTGRQLLLITFMLCVLMGSGIGYVWSNLEGTQIGYDVSRLKGEELRLKELNKKLRLELARLKSPQYLEDEARSLGLKPPSPAQIVVLP